MDVTLLRSTVYDLPSKQRVGAIVYDGAADMQLWPGPGSDSDLDEAFGGELQRALDAEIRRVEGKVLPIGSVIRVHPGRLHCDFLAWVATRPPEPGTERQPAPDAEAIRQAVDAALAFVAERNVVRVAFGAFGGGPGELPRQDRLVAIARAATAYHERCISEGRAPVVEEVLLCEPMGEIYRKAANLLRGEVHAAEPVPRPRPEPAPRKKRAPRSGGRAPRLDPDEVSRRRLTAESYSMRSTYATDDWFSHPKFGMGKVTAVAPEGAILVLFEDGEQRKLVHGRG